VGGQERAGVVGTGTDEVRGGRVPGVACGADKGAQDRIPAPLPETRVPSGGAPRPRQAASGRTGSGPSLPTALTAVDTG
jgi:hypothetical protein